MYLLRASISTKLPVIMVVLVEQLRVRQKSSYLIS
jgi:hypothetical protein